MQNTISILFLIFGIGIAAVFGWVAWSARRGEEYAQVLPGLNRARRVWGVLLGVMLASLFAFSLPKLPYTWAGGPGVTEQVVEVKAFQFGWQIAPQSLKRGLVEFRVTSADVNHDFGLYSPSGKLLGQTQAMPGYTNVLRIRLEEAGTYTVRCLEFCGVAHHAMMTTLTVE